MIFKLILKHSFVAQNPFSKQNLEQASTYFYLQNTSYTAESKYAKQSCYPKRTNMH